MPIESTQTYDTLHVGFGVASVDNLSRGGGETILPLGAGNQPPEILALLTNLTLSVSIDTSVSGRLGSVTQPAYASIDGRFRPIDNAPEGTVAEYTAADSLPASAERSVELANMYPRLGSIFNERVDGLSVAQVHNIALHELYSSSRIRGITAELRQRPRLAGPLARHLARTGAFDMAVHDGQGGSAEENMLAAADPTLYDIPRGNDTGLVLPPVGALAFYLCRAHQTERNAYISVLADERMLQTVRSPEQMAVLSEVVTATMRDMDLPVMSSSLLVADISGAEAIVGPEDRENITSQYDLHIAGRTRVPISPFNRTRLLGAAT